MIERVALLLNKFSGSLVYAAWSDTAKEKAAPLTDLEFIFERILNIATGFAVLAVFIMMVLGGFKLMTAGGDPKATESAKSTITYAIFGLVALVGIWLILKFVEVFTGVTVTKFVIQTR
ncbi:MAG: hypothetical protein Q8Q15_01940 [bacterium]|nr:hypothetical protein [bacterium]